MKKRLLTALIVLMGIFIYTSIICASENGLNYEFGGLNSGYDFVFDPAEENVWSMKIKISGRAESIMKIVLKNYTKEENNPKGYRQVLAINIQELRIRTRCMIYNDDSKDPFMITYYDRRIKRHSKTEFENNKYENTALTLKEIRDTAVKLIDRDQVTVNDTTVTIMERNITTEAFNRFW
jgi:hypothetical protein